MNILVIKLDQIGDVVLFTPFLRALRQCYPLAYISLVVSPLVESMVVSCPYVDEVKVYSRLKQAPGIIGTVKNYIRLVGWVKRELSCSYDLALVPRWAPDFYYAGPLAFFAGAKKRVTFSEMGSMGSKSRKFRDFFFTDLLYTTESVHERDINLDLIQYVGGITGDRSLELWPTTRDTSSLVTKLDSLGVRSPYICVSPGSMQRAKEWGRQQYAEVIKYLIQEYKFPVILVGGPAEAELGEWLVNRLGSGVYSLAGRTSLNETAALLGKAILYVGNDTGAMHISIAMKTPVIMISCFPKDGDAQDLNSPARFGPCPEVSSVVLQPEKALPPCDKQCFEKQAHCINQVTVEKVCNAVDKMLSSIAKADLS